MTKQANGLARDVGADPAPTTTTAGQRDFPSRFDDLPHHVEEAVADADVIARLRAADKEDQQEAYRAGQLARATPARSSSARSATILILFFIDVPPHRIMDGRPAAAGCQAR